MKDKLMSVAIHVALVYGIGGLVLVTLGISPNNIPTIFATPLLIATWYIAYYVLIAERQ